MTTGYTPIGKYYQKFFSQFPTNYPYREAKIQTHEHIVIEYYWRWRINPTQQHNHK